jgi:hypothetical protein
VLLFFSLALVLNVSASSAASVNQTNVSTPATSLDNMTANISTSNYATADNATTSIKSATTNTSNLNSTVTTNSSIKSATTNTTKTPNLNNTQAAGAPVIVNGLNVAQLKDGTSRAQAFFNKYDRLPTYVSFGTRKVPIATFEQNIATQGFKINTVIVNGLNIGQINDGISRVNAYYAANGRLPTYVSFGTRKIPIATFEQNIATQDLKINTVIVNGLNVAQLNDGISRVNAYYAANGRLPTYVSFGTRHIPIATFTQNIATQGLTINTTIKVTSTASLASIMTSAAKYGYSGAAHTAVDMVRIGSGDCWAMSDYLYTHMTKAGMTARIIQYATAYSSSHRSVQYRQNNTWVNAPYRTYFSTNMFNNTQSSGTVIESNL